MRRILPLMAAVVALGGGAAARAQVVEYIAPGSTVEGDYLRGVGIEAVGLGIYNWHTAVAESIHANTAIRVDQYVREVLRQGRARYAALRQADRERFDANFAAIRKRIAEHPEAQDVHTGNALNAIYERLNDPQIQASAYRRVPARLAIEDVRMIPFQMGDKGVTFSMQRLTARGKGKWSVAFQDPKYALARRAYERALDDALEHMVARDMPEEVIRNYERAIQGIAAQVAAEPWAPGNWLRIEANDQIHAMTRSVDLLKIKNIQGALAELDNYGGTTVNDLRLFMQRHNLRFAPATTPDERALYPRLYESFVAVRESVVDLGKDGDR